MKAISIIVPVYNCENFLEKSLDSLLAQDMDDYDIILVDDGSTDSSGAICDSYARKYERVRVIHQRNSGPGGARNAGVDAADSKYILFSDSDDLLVENSLSRIYRLAEENELDILNFSLRIFFDDPKLVSDQVYIKRLSVDTYRVMTGAECLELVLPVKEFYPVVTCRLYRSSYLKSIGLRFTPGIIHEDESYAFVSTLKAQRVMLIEDIMYLYRMHPESIMHSQKMKRTAVGIKNAIERTAEVLDELGEDWEDTAEAKLVGRNICRLACFYVVHYMMSDRNIRKDCREEFEGLIDRNAKYYRLLDPKTRLYTRAPYLFAYPYRVYRGLKALFVKGE
ncbi:MAG: glycosyltransferase [Firmicutes bacterium]|nr:glycosyltransferase [Bacillota bacterium]